MYSLGHRRDEIGEGIAGGVGDVDAAIVEERDRSRVAAELEAAVDYRAGLDQRGLEVDVEQVAGLQVVGSLPPRIGPVLFENGLVVDLARRDHVTGRNDHAQLRLVILRQVGLAVAKDTREAELGRGRGWRRCWLWRRAGGAGRHRRCPRGSAQWRGACRREGQQDQLDQGTALQAPVAYTDCG